MNIVDLLVLLVVQGCFFALLALALRFFFGRHVSRALERLKALQEEAMIKEQQLKDELDRAKAQSASLIENAKSEAERLIVQAKGDIEKYRQSAEAAMQDERRRMVEHGKKELRIIEDDLRKKSGEESIELAARLTMALLSDDALRSIDSLYVRRTVEALRDITVDFSLLPPEARVRIVSARLLEDNDRRAVMDFLCGKAGRLLHFQWTEDAALISGIVIKIGEFIADGSVAHKIALIAESMKRSS